MKHFVFTPAINSSENRLLPSQDLNPQPTDL